MVPVAHLLAGLLVVALPLASLLAWSYVLRLRREGRSLAPWEPRPTRPWGLFDLVLMAFGMVALQAAMLRAIQQHYELPAGALLADMPPATIAAVIGYNSLASVLTIAGAMAFVVLRYGGGRDWVGWSLGRFGHDLRLGLLGYLLLAPPTYLLQFVVTRLQPSRHPLVVLLVEHPSPWHWLVGVAAAVIVAPLAEEFLIRGLLQGWLERVVGGRPSVVAVLFGGVSPWERDDLHEHAASRSAAIDAVIVDDGDPLPPPPAETESNPYASPRATSAARHVEAAERESAAASLTAPASARWLPIVLSASLFALLHLDHGPDPIPLFFLALGLGWFYQRTGRLWASVVLHLLLNGTSILLVALAGDAMAGAGS